MKHLIYILVFAIAFTSCRSAKPTVETTESVVDTTTTSIRYIKQVDTIRIAGDTVKIIVPIASLTGKPIIKTSPTGRSKAIISKVNDNIEVECQCAEEQKIIETQNTVIETLTKRLETKATTVTKTEYKTPWYSKALNVVGIIALLIVLITLGIRRLKPF